MARTPEPPQGEPADPDTPPDVGAEFATVELPAVADIPPSSEPAADEVDTDERTVAELEQIAANRGVRLAEGTGSGRGGAIVKADLVAAIDATPEPPVGRPPLSMVAEAAVGNITPTVSED